MMILRKSDGAHRRIFWLFLCGGSDLPMSSRSQDEMLQSLTFEVRPWFEGQRHVAILFPSGVSENEVSESRSIHDETYANWKVS